MSGAFQNYTNRQTRKAVAVTRPSAHRFANLRRQFGSEGVNGFCT
jgi:hypothetical protein